MDTAVIFNGRATIEGTVREDLFVMNGDTEISGTVNGDVVVFNGDVAVRSSAEIGGDLVTQSTPQVEDGATIRGSQTNIATKFDYDMGAFAGRFVWWLGYTVSVLILGLLLLAFAPHLDEAVVETIRARSGSSIGWGVALFFLLPIAAILLLVTVVGIPLEGLFVMLALALIYTIGYAVATHGVGRLVMRSSSRYVAFLIGLVILRGLALIPILGGLLWLLASVWGLGAARGRDPRWAHAADGHGRRRAAADARSQLTRRRSNRLLRSGEEGTRRRAATKRNGRLSWMKEGTPLPSRLSSSPMRSTSRERWSAS